MNCFESVFEVYFFEFFSLNNYFYVLRYFEFRCEVFEEYSRSFMFYFE